MMTLLKKRRRRVMHRVERDNSIGNILKQMMIAIQSARQQSNKGFSNGHNRGQMGEQQV